MGSRYWAYVGGWVTFGITAERLRLAQVCKWTPKYGTCERHGIDGFLALDFDEILPPLAFAAAVRKPDDDADAVNTDQGLCALVQPSGVDTF